MPLICYCGYSFTSFNMLSDVAFTALSKWRMFHSMPVSYLWFVLGKHVMGRQCGHHCVSVWPRFVGASFQSQQALDGLSHGPPAARASVLRFVVVDTALLLFYCRQLQQTLVS